MTRKFLLCAIAALALAACQEEEDNPSSETESETSQDAETSTEDTSTADDGGAVIADAPTEAPAANVSEVTQDAIDKCIDALRAQAGSVSGTVQSTEFSEANSLVMLQDNDGNIWRCVVSNDASTASVEAQEDASSMEDGSTENTATADDGGGAMDGSTDGAALSPPGVPTDVTEFVGAPAGQAAGGLEALGFENIRTEGLTAFWFNRDTGTCARITTADGLFSDVVVVPAEDC